MVVWAALCGLGFGAGVLLILVGVRRGHRAQAADRVVRSWARLVGGRRPAQLAAVALASVVVGLATGWPVAALLTALGGWALPALLGASGPAPGR